MGTFFYKQYGQSTNSQWSQARQARAIPFCHFVLRHLHRDIYSEKALYYAHASHMHVIGTQHANQSAFSKVPICDTD